MAGAGQWEPGQPGYDIVRVLENKRPEILGNVPSVPRTWSLPRRNKRMKIDEQILLNQLAQGLIDLAEGERWFKSLGEGERRAALGVAP